MKFLLSMNYKFFDIKPKTLVGLIESLDFGKYVGGAELYIRPHEPKDFEYVRELTLLFKERKWELQIHGPSIEQLDSDLLLKYEHIALAYGEEIVVVTHPIFPIETCVKHYQYIQHITKRKPLHIIIENLNHLNGSHRPHVLEVIEICKHVPGLNMCWDVGHEIMDGNQGYKPPALHVGNNVINVHIHDIKEGVDHYPFLNQMVDPKRVINVLREMDYKNNVVLEIALDYIQGETFDDKMKVYLEEFENFHSANE